jgi:hypothetical protein
MSVFLRPYQVEAVDAAETRVERIAARIKRQAAQAASWPGFEDPFWTNYPHPPMDPLGADVIKMAARSFWDSGRPSADLIVAIVLTLRLQPNATLDPKTGRRLTAAEFLGLLWPGPTPEQLRRMIDEPDSVLEIKDDAALRGRYA